METREEIFLAIPWTYERRQKNVDLLLSFRPRADIKIDGNVPINFEVFALVLVRMFGGLTCQPEDDGGQA